MMIDIANMEINVLIDEGLEGCPEVGWLQSIAEQVLVAQDVGSRVEMGLVIASQERMLKLNQCYLGKDEPTDVLAFYMPAEPSTEGELPPFVQPPDGVLHLGEVIISYPQAVIQAKEHHHSVKREMAILIIHGVLHLLGYRDDEPELKRQMRAKEAKILSLISNSLSPN